MAENDGQGQACRQCGQPCDNLTGDPGRWAHALALDPLLPGVTSWYCATCVHGWQIALTDIRELMSPKNRQRFVMGGPMAFSGVYNVVEDALAAAAPPMTAVVAEPEHCRSNPSCERDPCICPCVRCRRTKE